jgi:regulator of protease activity HflC (stomatin/prohibitin superfamily)
VSIVEIKDVEIPQGMQRAMARQAEAERERRAKVIAAEGEFQASQRLSDAAVVLDRTPTALQLRFLQTLIEVASEKNSTTIFPLPIDLISPFLRNKNAGTNEPVRSDGPRDTDVARPASSGSGPIDVTPPEPSEA